jgi:S1-C subfamily serine protease
MSITRIPPTVVLLALLALPRPAGAQKPDELAAILEKAAPSIVTVKVVIKTEVVVMGQAQNEETRADLQGVVVDESGLIMISNAEISADRVKDAISGVPGAMNMDFKVTPTDFKVIFENEQEELAAFLVAKDTKLDLAFVQVEDLAGRRPPAVDFADSAKAAIGQEVVAISRLKKGYDYAPYFASARISGAIRKPRKAWTIDGDLAGYGLPVFTVSGDVVGTLVTLTPTTRDEGAGAGLGGIMRLMRGGGMDTGVGTFVLPGGVVNGLVGQAKDKAGELLAERSEATQQQGGEGEG